MEQVIFRRARAEELPQIMAMQMDVFHGEQEIPAADVVRFTENDPVCWCAVADGSICGCAAAWKEGNEVHWGRFIVLSALRGQRIGTGLARHSFADLFRGGAEELHMEARDAAVKIICTMGGEIAGEPRPFYRGNVTPVVLKKEKFIRNG